MNISLFPPLSLHEKGKRDNNEDSIYPDNAIPNPVNGLYMVCDGVGGCEKGEVASHLACRSFAEFIARTPSEKYDLNYFSDALSYVETRFDDYISENPQAKGMATTLTLAYVHPDGLSLVHIGDSRIYHIRKNAIIFQSKDHSYINALIATGVITEEEAKDHPQRNVILRAITGKSVKPAKPDFYACTTIETGDYFFLCSDGVLESVSDEDLIDVVCSNETEEEKIENIKRRCNQSSDDNFSCILLKVASVEPGDEPVVEPGDEMTVEPGDETTIEPDTIALTEPLPAPAPKPEPPSAQPNSMSKRKNNKTLLYLILFIIFSGALGLFFLNRKKKKKIESDRKEGKTYE